MTKYEQVPEMPECTCDSFHHPDDPTPFIGHQPPVEGCPVHDGPWTEPMHVDEESD